MTIFAVFLFIPVVIHLTTGHFAIEPKSACIAYKRRRIPFSELGVPCVLSTTHIEVSGEFGELLRVSPVKALQAGPYEFFRGDWLSKRKLEKIANALNDAIREYDEREAVRTWLDRLDREDSKA